MTSWKHIKHTCFKYGKGKEGLLTLDKACTVVIKEEHGQILTFRFKKGLVWDGLSIPKGLRWFLSNDDPTNDLYNIAGLVHDACYGSALVDKETADDIFRSLLRDSGISRFKAGCAEKAVNWFASKHYGVAHDKYGIRFNVSVQRLGSTSRFNVTIYDK